MEATLTYVDPTNLTHFCNSFWATVEEIAKGLYTSQATAENGH